MKKQLKALVISIIAVVFLTASYFILNALLPKKGSDDSTIQVVNGSADDMCLITVEFPQSKQDGYKYAVAKTKSAAASTGKSTSTTASADDTTYIFYDNGIDDGYGYSQGALKQAFTRLMSLTADSIVTAEENVDLTQYGLDDANAVKVTATPYDTSGAKTVTLLIGSYNDVYSGYYAKLADAPTVYLINLTNANTFVTGSLRYRSLDLIPSFGTQYYNGINRITFTNMSGDTMVMERFASYQSDVEGQFIYTTFHMTSPYTAYVSDEAVGENMLDLLTNAEVVQAIENRPTAEDLTALGFNHTCTLTIEMSGDLTATYKFGIPDGNMSSGQYYLMVNDVDTVYQVYGTVTFADKKPIDFLSGLVWLHDIKKADTVKIEIPSGTYTLKVNDTTDQTNNTGSFVGSLDGATVTENNARQLYASIISITYDGLTSDQLLETTPSYRFTITYKSGFTQTVSFYKVNSRQYAVLLDNAPLDEAGFCVNITDLRKVSDNIDTIRAGGTIAD